MSRGSRIFVIHFVDTCSTGVNHKMHVHFCSSGGAAVFTGAFLEAPMELLSFHLLHDFSCFSCLIAEQYIEPLKNQV